MSINISDIKKMSKQALKAKEIQDNEKLQATMASVQEKACIRATGWLAKETEHLKADIESFFHKGDLLKYLAEGCGVSYGRIDYESIASKDFGAYVLGLESSNPGSHFPFCLKINIRANAKLAKVIGKAIGVNFTDISREAIGTMMMAENEGKIKIVYQTVSDFLKTVGKGEPLELCKTKAEFGKNTIIDVSCVGFVKDNTLYIARTDWYDADSQIPVKEFIFDIWHIYVPRNEEN